MLRPIRMSSAQGIACSLVLGGVLWGAASVLQSAHAASTAPFLAHQAVYELSLQKARGNASINSARGRILYNFTGSSCEGYTTEFRQVFVLRDVEELSNSEVAEILDLSVAAVKSRLHRARLKVRNRLVTHFSEPNSRSAMGAKS